MGDTVLITDSCCDLPPSMVEAAGIEVLPFPYTLDGEEYLDDFGRTIPFEDFYAALDSGSVARTSQVPLVSYYEAFEHASEQGKAVLLISLSSALSGSHDTSVLARDRFLAENPNAEIYCVDSKCVSSGQGLLVLEAARRLADPEQGDYLFAPLGAGVYWLKDAESGECIYIGEGGHVAYRMTSLLPATLGRGTRNNRELRNYVFSNLSRVEYRTHACASKKEAQALEIRLRAENAPRF